jgi:putative NIF3 family GTP cyclohydrolase 1 type 2
MTQLSRREFTAMAAAAPLAFTRNISGSAPIAAQDVIDRIKNSIGVPWKTETVDGLKAGDAAASIKGIATTAMATLDVLRRAASAGANFIVTFEPTFYAKSDARTAPAGRGGGRAGAAGAPAPPDSPSPSDPVFSAKNELVDKNNLVVFRLSDHWRLRAPDPLTQGLADTLGWQKYQQAGDASRCDIPASTLGALASDLKKRLNARGGVRVVGDPRTPIRTVGLLPGSTPIAASLKLLPSVDVIVAGEVREWESVEYARDVVFSGQKIGLILVGRVVSEDPGMAMCAKWLEALVSEVPVRHIGAGDPYWRPTT